MSRYITLIKRKLTLKKCCAGKKKKKGKGSIKDTVWHAAFNP